MGKEAFSKIKLLKIWEILKQDSDENNPLTTNQIIDKLAASGIGCDRRTLYQDITALNSYGYEVVCKTTIMCWIEILTCLNFAFL